jgi:hypothetical protein
MPTAYKAVLVEPGGARVSVAASQLPRSYVQNHAR